MPDVETALRQLAGDVDWPAEPSLAPRVGALLRAEPAQERRRSLRPLALAFAVLVAALAVALAVPPARSAILDFFGIGGVEVRRVETLPRATTPLPLGSRTALDAAVAEAEFPVSIPDVELDGVYVDRTIPGGRVSFVWREGGRRVVLSEFEGRQTPYFEKLVGPSTSVEHLTFRGAPAVWLSGPRHVVLYADRTGFVREDPPRSAGNVLIWDSGRTTFRLENAPTRERALEILGTLRESGA